MRITVLHFPNKILLIDARSLGIYIMPVCQALHLLTACTHPLSVSLQYKYEQLVGWRWSEGQTELPNMSFRHGIVGRHLDEMIKAYVYLGCKCKDYF